MTAVAGGATKMDMEYRYSTTTSGGRITQAKDWALPTPEEVTYEYDSLNRLINAYTTGPEWGQNYAYDGFGNMSAQSVTKGSAPAWSLTVNGANNRVANWVYDANGNVANDGTRTYTYDVGNRLVSTSSSGQVYGYDSANQRVFDGVNYTFWSPDGRRIFRYQLAPALGRAGGRWALFRRRCRFTLRAN